MSYAVVAEIRANFDLRNRVSACVAVEGIPADPEQWAYLNSWKIAAQPGWADAWKYALATKSNDPNYSPGSDEAVITDAMILAAVQSIRAAGDAEPHV